MGDKDFSILLESRFIALKIVYPEKSIALTTKKVPGYFSFDCILLEVEQIGNACHAGAKTCFFNNLLTQKKGTRLLFFFNKRIL